MTGEEKLIAFTEDNYQKTLTRVNERIYHFLGYGHSNMTAILADHSIILVDAMDSPGNAQAVKEELARITDKPVRTIIYTHSHPDHRGGAGVFRETVQEIIAYTPCKPALQYYDRLNDVLGRRGKFQHGYGLTDAEAICQGIGPREGKELGAGGYDFLPPTTTYCNETVHRVIDGVPMQLFAAPGETDDQLGIWLEEDEVLCTGDNYYGCWPNLYAIRGTQYRDVSAWIDTLDHILSFPAKALLPGHTRALLGRETVQEIVGSFRNALESILFQTLDCMNRGMTLEETVRAVQLPAEYAAKPYLGEYYGTIEWSVKSIYNGYLGWFDGDPVKLMPVAEREYNAVLLELIGSTDKVMEKVRSCIAEGSYQMALQLLALLPEEHPDLKKEALLGRARQMTSANARHYLIASAK